MSILNLIERLREKPKDVRVQVSFITAICVTGLVALVWGMTLPMRFDALGGVTEVAQENDASRLGTFFGDARSNLGQLISGTPETEAPADEPAPTSPSGAYEAGAPAGTTYPAYQIEEREPAVTPVDRREVLIGTTTSTSR